MWVLWLICALLLIVAVVLLIRPLFKTYSDSELRQNQKQANRRKELNIELYEQKKAQIELDYTNGLLDDEGRTQAHHEIEHSLIQDAKVSSSAELMQLSKANARILAVVFLVFIPVFAMLTYAFIMPKNFEQVVLGKQPAQSPMSGQQAPMSGQQAPDMNSMVISLENKLQANPDNIQGWNMLGRSYVVMKRFADAIGAYEKALELNKTTQEKIPGLEINYVEALMQTGIKQNYQKAQNVLQVLLTANPNNGDALWFMGFLDYQAGNKVQAVERWTYLLSLIPTNSEQAQIVKRYLSQVRSELPEGHPARAADKQVAVDQDSASKTQSAPKGPAPGQQMTGSSEEQAFIASMIARVESRVKANPQDLKGWKSLGKSYAVLKRYTDSANAYAKAVALDSSDVSLLMDYSNAAIKTQQADQLDTARMAFAQLLDKTPENTNVLFLSGSLARAAGDVEEAKRFWNKLLPLLAKGSAAYINVENNLKSL